MPQTNGASRWSEWRLKMWSCHTRCREPWLPKQRQLERPEQRWGSNPYVAIRSIRSKRVKVLKAYRGRKLKATSCVPSWSLSLARLAGDRSGGWDERLPRPEGGVPGHRRVPVSPAAPLPADPQHHRGGKELHHHLPAAHGCHVSLHAEVMTPLSASPPFTWHFTLQYKPAGVRVHFSGEIPPHSFQSTGTPLNVIRI